ncbi:hypothetical protein [Streptomyces sp. HB2AG]|uniref:hypothetical protein n=1 Tax=Streptomyces sp. HB2AG TaxID=2983400 RepID=UPI0022AA11FB|nr:hypothetical protein [Streptomyces sp. HB2AG]MCZ2525087.1 hypothetical protein [Streptomyces sp. HB2AG]
MTAFQRAGADLRLLRAAVFTAVCVVLAAAGHSLASGSTVPVGSLAAGWLALFAVTAALAGRERALAPITVGLLAGQAGLHLLFNGLETARSPRPAPSGVADLAARLMCGEQGPIGERTAHDIVLRAGLDPADYADTAVTAAAHHGQMAYSWSMLAGHLAAAAVAGWLLRRGEAALWGLLRLCAQAVAAASSPLRVLRTATALLRALLRGTGDDNAPHRRARRDEHDERPLEAVLLQNSVVRRGPPAPCALAA